MKTKLYIIITGTLLATAGTSIGQPVIASQPKEFPVLSLGASASNWILVSGAGPFGYQWRKNGVSIPGRTTSSIVITNLQVSDEGAYDVVVTNFGELARLASDLVFE